MKPHQLLNKGEAEAGALLRTVALPLDTAKPLKNPRQLTFGNAEPMPVSRTTSSAAVRSGAVRIVTETSPVSVYLNAFDTRLRTIFSHISRST